MQASMSSRIIFAPLIKQKLIFAYFVEIFSVKLSLAECPLLAERRTMHLCLTKPLGG